MHMPGWRVELARRANKQGSYALMPAASFTKAPASSAARRSLGGLDDGMVVRRCCLRTTTRSGCGCRT